MTSIMAFIKRHPVLSFYILTFAISWGGILMAVGPEGFPVKPEQLDSLLLIVISVLLAGPPIAGLLLTGLVYGRAGYRELLSRLLRWRVGARWYAVALLFAPLLYVAILLALSLFSSEFLPGIVTTSDKASLLLFGITAGLVGGGFMEELGWTGFTIPTLRQRYSVLTTGLIVGVLWAVWHVLVTYWMSGISSGPLNLTSYLLDPFLFLVAFRVLMVWVYDRTGSLLLAMLMHTSLTASARIFSPLEIAGVTLLTFDLIWAAATWIIVAALAIAIRRQLSRPPLQRRVA